MTEAPHHNSTDNTKNSGEKSPHASISFTAHYTGQMWQKLGLSHPALATQKGERLHKILAPVEAVAKTFFGVTMGKTLTVRHALMDKRIDAFIAAHPNAQIVEVAAGLSPRGWRYLQKYTGIAYAEVDLPDMSALKKARAEGLPKPTPQFFAADLLADDLDVIFNRFDTSRPLMIVSEGLINYFTLDMIGSLSERLATQLRKFPNSLWLTENYPYSDKASYNALVKVAGTVLRTLSKSSFSFYFDKPKDAITFFTEHGYVSGDVFQPTEDSRPENNQHLGDTVWVMEFKA